MSHVDMIKAGAFQLKKVDRSAPLPPKPGPQDPVSYLDLIKSGQFKLKKVDPVATPAPRVEEAAGDASNLSLQDILARAASIREAVKVSDSSEEEKSSTTSW
jgi:hypothetical protein